MQLSRRIKKISAKSSPENSALSLPVYIHSIDTANMMEYLYVHRLSPLERECLSGASDAERIRLVRLLGMLHDIGKFTPGFQSKIVHSIDNYGDLLNRESVPISVLSDAVPHALAGEVILLWAKLDKNICEIVGSHHGKPQEKPKALDIATYPSSYCSGNSELWHSIWKEWIDYSLCYCGFDEAPSFSKLSKKSKVILSGMLIMADWIASNQYYFPLYAVDTEIPHNVIETRINNAMKRLRFTDIWRSTSTIMDSEMFQSKFGFSGNELQTAVISELSNSEKPGIVIIEAQMGVGKTEAALAAAEIMAAKLGCGGLFFGLPTQATANCIFERCVDWLQNQKLDNAVSMRLAHANSGFIEAYSSLPTRADEVVTFDEDSNISQNAVIAHSWFAGNKRALLSDFVIGTVDQLLMASLKQKHFMLRHLGLAGKVVIIDECHAYDAYMNTYLDRTLTWLGAYNVPVIILSATLPGERRAGLLNAYLKKTDAENVDYEKIGTSRAYPLITYSDGKTVVQKEDIIISSPKRNVQIQKLDNSMIADVISEEMIDGGCVGIIVNTVKKAQSLAQMLKSCLPSMKVVLYHSQFIMKDRANIEKKLISLVGKKSLPKDRDNVIVIGTQVLEQSLDIDFDLLITDLCPMDLLLHRHKRARPALLETPRCFVLNTEQNIDDSIDSLIYDKWLLHKTSTELPPTVTLPSDISPLVQRVYGGSPESSCDDKVKGYYEEYKAKKENKKQRAEVFCIAEPSNGKFGNTLHGMLNQGFTSDKKAEAKVRDGSESVELIILAHKTENTVETVDGSLNISVNTCPSYEEAIELSKHRLRLPSALCSEYKIDGTISELEKMSLQVAEFQSSGLLAGELFLVLDSNYKAKLNGYCLSYSSEEGLVTIKEGGGKENGA
ncbi:MAG: CRISPR-associated helicase Cas3' [Oscillospiraceae bacterium]|nr:CRISPR-associated helicase Cas3' [Oscillospiraceae bacterium]